MKTWMKSVMELSGAAIFFQPQIRTKIVAEGWATLAQPCLQDVSAARGFARIYMPGDQHAQGRIPMP